MMRSLRQTQVEEVLRRIRIYHAASTIELIDKATNGKDYRLIIAGGETIEIDSFEPIRTIRRAGFKGKLWVFHWNKEYRERALDLGANGFYVNTKIRDDERFKRDLAKL